MVEEHSEMDEAGLDLRFRHIPLCRDGGNVVYQTQRDVQGTARAREGQDSITAGRRERDRDASSFSMVCTMCLERVCLQPRMLRDDGHSKCA